MQESVYLSDFPERGAFSMCSEECFSMPQMIHGPFRHILILAMFDLILQENYIKVERSGEVEEAILTMNDRQALVSAAMHIICVRNIIF